MSKLASKIQPEGPVVARRPDLRGPRNKCFPLYGTGDLEDWQAVDALRESMEWRAVQAHVDQALGIEAHIDLERFRRHWRRRCDCWPPELKL